MKKEDRELLIKDLCSRLPYRAKVYGNYVYSDGEKIIDDERVEVLDASTLDWVSHGIEIKPYLFPLSSMTEEQREEYHELLYNPENGIGIDYFDWCHKNHFDCRHLIQMGLAIDATGLNIY